MKANSIDNIQTILKKHKQQLLQFPIQTIFLFGSFAAKQHSEDSDVDLLIRFHSPIGYFDFFALQHQLQQWLGRDVDLRTEDSLHPLLKEDILREAILLDVLDAA